ncbi:trace amine-associated receptor 6-like [Stylophora pistillata]|uniref:trace amine-associated receptor 6-like n=1 Tax=Stylophora pistillata TaxID=50429 RepID=UPI000C039014|nr:trace amine-associated receptor 6-like [Stylophora pistillata]
MNSSEPTYVPSTEVVGANVVIFAIFDFIFGTVIVLVNGFLFITIYRDPCRCLRTPSVFLIANLSVADLFIGIVSILRGAELTYFYRGLGDLLVLNLVQYFIGAVSILAAVCTLMAMSYERYVAVIKPFQYPRKITNKKAKIATAVTWINGLIMSVLPIADVKREKFLLAYCYSHFVIPSFILIALYMKIYKAVARQREELKDVRESLTAASKKKQLERENRMFIAFVLILFVFYMSFVPYFIHVQILYFCPCRNSYAYHVYYYVANEFLSMSSIINPFLYAWRLPKFSRSFRSWFRGWLVKNSGARYNENPPGRSEKVVSSNS